MTDTKMLEFTRDLPLSPDRLWPVLTDAEHRSKWGAPEEGMVLEVERADTREGGEERHYCGPADNPEFVVDTRWYKLAGPDLAVFTETLLVGGETIFTSLVTYAVSAAGSGAKLEVAVAISSFVGDSAFDDVAQGWEGGLANLEAYAGQQVADA